MTPLEYLTQEKFQSFKPGFDRVEALLEKLGHPERKLRYVHVAGTNGKGSTCACVSSILTKAGYKTGLYISPYVIRWNERVQVDGEYISDGDLEEAAAAVRSAEESMEDPPSQFELETALALWYFARRGCEFAVMEVGMGGAWDATNVIPAPEAAVLCAIALDHTAVLGSTVAEIAAVKAGIVKPGCDVVSYGSDSDAERVIESVCMEKGCRRFRPDFGRIRVLERSLTGVSFDYAAHKGLFLPLAGTYQPKNAALAIETAEALRTRGFHISDEAIREGLAAVRWPGRFELIHRDPLFILDGSHNPQGMEATAESLRAFFPDRKLWFLMGIMADKDVHAVAKLLAPLAAGFAAVEPPNPRAMKPAELAALLAEETGAEARPFDSIEEGAKWVLDRAGKDGVCAALGSLYFSPQVREAVEHQSELRSV
ncbi:MAG: bifunctional folylpolyglutamate synthase/dihydrofolate synthase [Oscillospiraceae bacterium]|nr:bifunctional folylpolyglutamate synthase/dihydrofolate synthase [Oscillospiraceae bacterium]